MTTWAAKSIRNILTTGAVVGALAAFRTPLMDAGHIASTENVNTLSAHIEAVARDTTATLRHEHKEDMGVILQKLDSIQRDVRDMHKNDCIRERIRKGKDWEDCE